MTASAKSLFRALRHKPAAAETSLFDGLPDHRKPQAGRRDLDFYPTRQTDAIRALLAAEGPRIRSLGRRAWDCCVGAGDLATPMAEAGLDVVGSDLVHRGWDGTIIRDFYAWTASPAPVIITNPPYNQINARDGHGRWLRHTLDMPGWTWCAMLLSWDWPAAKQNGLGALMDARPFTRSYLCRWKIDFTGEGSPPQRNAWFVWDREDLRARDGTRPHPDFCWLDKCDERQAAMI